MQNHELQSFCADRIAQAKSKSKVVNPEDKFLMLPGIEYGKVTRDRVNMGANTAKVEIFDKDSYQQTYTDDTEFETKLQSQGWQQTAEWNHVEGSIKHFQRQKPAE